MIAGIPVGDSEQSNGLFTGDGEFNQVFALQVGHSLYPAPAYLKGEIGFNNRERGFSDELRYSIEAGYVIGERLGVTVWIRGVEAVGKDDDDLTVSDLKYLSIGPELNLYITTNLGITAGVTKYANARNLLDSPAWDIGVFFKL